MTTLFFAWPEHGVWKRRKAGDVYLNLKHSDKLAKHVRFRMLTREPKDMFEKTNKINYCPIWLNKFISFHNTPPTGGIRWYKRWTVSLGTGGCLKLVVSTESFSKVGHLATHEQVVLVHDLFFGQTVILKKRKQTSVRTQTIHLAVMNTSLIGLFILPIINQHQMLSRYFVCESSIRLVISSLVILLTE